MSPGSLAVCDIFIFTHQPRRERMVIMSSQEAFGHLQGSHQGYPIGPHCLETTMSIHKFIAKQKYQTKRNGIASTNILSTVCLKAN